ncbi:phosphoribosylamine--glycine ligase [Gudongella oleilytica]|uniref:phosphoribosylamine--glycine ligase n=1 Tax=Gudongella oleilytica TaxID=1582259 RepID=UPI002A368F86|nr:phosphoribosylamine--glycine ligase [Gudongella oleilytica]MDY0256742.1 phosphoribosylamine--glycine ligase [Gudongella oleilytica]
MRILVIGSGGREHALCWKLSQSELIEELYCAPGNGGTSSVATNVGIAANDIDRLLEFAQENEIDLTIVGPEEPLVLGITDSFEEAGLNIFGPNAFSAQLEGSKDFAKRFMMSHGIPTARYRTYTDLNEALKGIAEFSYPLVVKADGLCLGKGVTICEDRLSAEKALKESLQDKVFGKEGDRVVVEEFLTGTEASLLCFVSHNKLFPMESAKDYKQIYDGDKGPNTGGVGCYSPSPLFTPKLKEIIRNSVLAPIERGLEKDGHDFTGILFIGFMIEGDDPRVLEFNVRFGDPETEVVLPRLKTDLGEIFFKALSGDLKEEDIQWDENPCVTVVLTSGGYPGYYRKGYEISGTAMLQEDLVLFHNGTRLEAGKLLTNGGRVLSLTATGAYDEARSRIYKSIDLIDFKDKGYRTDIAKL